MTATRTTNFDWVKLTGEQFLEPDHYNAMLDDIDAALGGAFLSNGITVGVDSTGYDVKFFGDTTGKSWLWDESADKMIVTGASDLLGNTQQTGTFTVGVNGTGYDVQFFGDTAGNNWLWDESADKVVQTSASSSTNGSTSVESYTSSMTMTGIGGVGGRARFFMTTNVALGSWSNALKGEVTYGAAGKTTGLGSAILAEMTLSAGTADGNYAPLELELNLGSGALTGTKTSLMYASVNGADKATFDTNGYLLNLAGVTEANAKMFNAHTLSNINEVTHGLRVHIAGADYYLLAATQANFVD